MTISEQPSLRQAVATANPGHGETFTDHMFSMNWSPARGWHEPELGPVRNLSLHPATIGLHYGQVAFEGLKAHWQADGHVAVFRPLDHARRFQRSTRRLAMPELPEELFLRAVDEVVSADQSWLSDDPSHSIYVRPFMFATDVSLMLRPSQEYRFLLMAFLAGGFFGDEVESVSVLISREYSRAMAGGTGDVKIAGTTPPPSWRNSRRRRPAASRSSGSTRPSAAGSRRWAA